MNMVDPDVESGDQVLLEVVPDVDRDGCGWLRETEIDDMMMEKFVLVPEMSPIGSMTSAAEPTFLPALSDVCSLVVLAEGGGRCCGKPPGSCGVRYSASECQCFVGLRVGPSCLRVKCDEFFGSAGCRSD